MRNKINFRFKEEIMSHRNTFENEHHNNHGYHANHYGYDFEHRIKNYFIGKLRNNKKLLLLLIIAIVCIIAIGIFLLISFLPVIFKGIEYINTNGIKGVVDIINQFVEKLWVGKGKLI
jgi:hypothetical protein